MPQVCFKMCLTALYCALMSWHMFRSEASQKAQSSTAGKISNLWLVPNARDFYLFYPACLGVSLRLSVRIHKQKLVYSLHKPLTLYNWSNSVRCSLEKHWEKRGCFIKAKFQISVDTNTIEIYSFFHPQEHTSNTEWYKYLQISSKLFRARTASDTLINFIAYPLYYKFKQCLTANVSFC